MITEENRITKEWLLVLLFQEKTRNINQYPVKMFTWEQRLTSNPFLKVTPKQDLLLNPAVITVRNQKFHILYMVNSMDHSFSVLTNTDASSV